MKIDQSKSNEVFSLVSNQKVYRELEGISVVEINPAAQLEANLELLENLQKRLSFMMREVRVVLKVEDPF